MLRMALLGIAIHSGHYIPQLAEAMVEFNKKDRIFNLRGVAVSHLILFLQLKVGSSDD